MGWDRLSVAKIVALKTEPYLDVALYALVTTPTPGMSTMAVDRWWRLYVSADMVEEWSIEQLATGLRHEARHLLFNHAGRADEMEEVDHDAWNRAADAAINKIIDDTGHADWPFPVVMPSSVPGGRADMVAEEFYELLASTTDAGPQPGPGPVRQDSRSAAEGSSQPGGNSDGNSDGDTGDNTRTESRDGSVDGSDGLGEAKTSSASATGRPCGGGSGSGGEPLEGEEPPGAGADGVSDDIADIIRRRAAARVKEVAARGRGTVPADMEIWADQVLRPQHDWRQDLAGLIRQTIDHRRGRLFVTSNRFSRRHLIRSGHPLMPGRARPQPPLVDVVVDTSGSMRDQIGDALAEAEGILHQHGDTHNRVIFCDAAAYTPQRGRSVQTMTVKGGGGTDMRVGIQLSQELRPRADIVVVITDMMTPWPTIQPRGQSLIICAVGDYAGDPPAWAKIVRIPGKPRR